ncbi:MAG: hypothetical protein KKG84_03720, partial [Candidatus Omnitrophica bacterium]|nr:hypothetical protein [Candidatus Omnitrophota bacterium]
MMFLLSDTVLWGMPVEDVAVPNNTLQVQSQMFAPIIHLPGWEKDAQVEAEMNAIVVLVMKDSKRAARDINSSIDRWCGAKSKERVLTLLEDARTNASGETVIDIGFLEPKEGDMPFRLTINASSFEALISEPRKKVKMTRLNVSAKKTRDFYGRTAEYDASGRITKVYDEKTGIVWEEYSYGKDPEDIAVRLYNPSIGKHIRCVYSFKRNNFVRWKIEIENSSGIFNEEGNFLVGEGDAFIEQLDINVSLGNSGIGTTVKQWLALRADREGKSILFSETMNPISARINAKLYDLSTLRLTQGDIVREIKVSNEKELMTAVTAQEYEIVKNDNFIGFITVTESGEIVDNDEAFKGYDLSLRNGILNAVDPKGDPVEVNYRHPFYWFGMADAEKIIAAQNRSDEERKKRTISGIAERITGRTTEYDASGRITKVYDENTGIVWEEYSYGEDPEDIAVKLYNPSIGKHIRCVYSFKIYNSLLKWKIEIENDPGIFNEKGYFLIGEGDAFIELLDIDVSPRNSGIGTTVMQWLALKADREGKEIGVSKTMNPVTSKIIAKFYDLSTLCLTQRDIGRVIKVSNEKELMTAVTAQEYEIVKNENFIGFITVTESGEIVDKDEALEGYDLSLRNGILNAVDPEGDPVEVNYKYPLYWFGMADAEKIIAAQNRSEEKRKERTGPEKAQGPVKDSADPVTYADFILKIAELSGNGLLEKTEGKDVIGGLVYDVITGGQVSADNEKEREAFAKTVFLPRDKGMQEKSVHLFEQDGIDAENIRYFLKEKDIAFQNKALNGFEAEENKMIEKAVYAVEAVLIRALFGIFVENDKMIEIYEPREGEQKGHWEKIKELIHKGLLTAGRDGRIYELVAPIVNRLNGMSDNDVIAKGEEEILHPLNERYVENFHLNIEDLDETFEAYVNRKVPAGYNYIITQSISTHINSLGMVNPDNPKTVERNLGYFEIAFILVKAIDIIASRKRDTAHRFLEEVKNAKARGGLIGKDAEGAFSALAYEILTGKSGPETGMNAAKEIMSGADEGSALRKNIREFCGGNTADTGSMRDFLDGKKAILRYLDANGFSGSEKDAVSRIIHRSETVFIYALFDIFLDNDTLKNMFAPNNDEVYWGQVKGTLHSELLGIGMNRRVYDIIGPAVRKIN